MENLAAQICFYMENHGEKSTENHGGVEEFEINLTS